MTSPAETGTTNGNGGSRSGSAATAQAGMPDEPAAIAGGGSDDGGSGRASGGSGASLAEGGVSQGESSGAAGAAGSDGSSPCTFDVTWSTSAVIPTVGIVEWTSAFDAIDGASVEFGAGTDYGHVAPVDLGDPQHRTLLLGLKALHAYHFRVVAKRGSSSCASRDFTLTTGALPNGLPNTALDLNGSSSVNFLLSSFVSNGPAFVLDADGDYVWAYGTGEMARAALSHDGKYMWFSAINVAATKPSMKRVTLDGLEETDFTAEFGQIHHDFAILPDDTIAFLQHEGEVDSVMERAPDGTMREVANLGTVLGAVHTHANSVRYFAADDTYTVSELQSNSITKLTRSGDVVWTLGGSASDFSGDTAWTGQHGQELIDPTHILVFSNGPPDGDSSAFELELDPKGHTAKRVWNYEPNPGLQCAIYGDVQRLAGGNTLVTFSVLGVIDEVDPNDTLVRELSWEIGGAVGYATALDSLYPASP
ncbi:MAG TPA: aryl-sulfate sulfotransferase [Polyangiaceae bacterium]|nr:aryl-sulfate sulfotransferase [Polyangiaceae bacterium]